MTAPRAFISYSWSSPEHQTWVLELATNLVESGVDVVLDKWDLKEGHDKFVFMERMVTDPEIKKVLVICDRTYAAKADARRGGVGTESQIMSAEVYEKTDQSKFVPIVTELTDDGKAALPTYLTGRIYIDMSNPANRYENFEQLLRWIFDRPMYQRPQVGKPPVYITQAEAPQLATSMALRAAVEAVRLAKPSAVAMTEDYLEVFANGMETFRVNPTPDLEFDDAVVASVESFRPHRDEVTDLVLLIGRYRGDREIYDVLHRWLERILLYKYPPQGMTSWQNDAFDNYKFILNELCLYVTAALPKARRYEQLASILGTKFYIPAGRSTIYEERIVPFDAFREYVRSLDETRNKRLKLNRLSVVSDLLKSRSTRSDMPFDDIMQADFVLVVYSVLHFPDDIWFPNTLLYAAHGRPAFELFARARSKRAFAPIRELFGVDTKEELVERFKENGAKIRWHQLWQWDGFNPLELMSADRLASEP